ncbi:hypothetical protein D7B24_000740 [Verticillium nonalfalfae]|uniref:Proteophosphoglycan 5 n=1 Tax=Verticillium nonalfalfae TaxID=1051616 RepID=A0A3M9Y2K1_9PEZI|nr:uncharacterized protein D7B24_000740 [Verticillium nonalfalfae]RNJ54282.1 hypothetical protein D7B24_000740 [Verticillium nonalfalfae]
MEQAKPTPSRRRAARNNGKPALQRMYASENDLPVTSKMGYDQGPQPSTPQKSGSPAFDMQPVAFQQGSAKASRARNNNQNATNQGSHNKARPKQSTTSPDFARTARQTTPNSAAVPRLPSSAAFAGATFHASPAPSALPIPSFYKPFAGSPSTQTRHQDAQQQPSPPATEPEMPTPQRPLANEARESPLEAMFRADRAEKEKARRPSFVSDASTSRHLFSPNAMPQGSQTMPRQHYGLPRDKPFQQRSSSGIPMAELDGVAGRPVGPAFSTPYQDRIRAARGPVPQPTNNGVSPSQLHEDPTEALKKYLFGPKNSGSETTSSALPNEALVSSSAPASRPAGLLAMEDDLRRILKLS